MAGFVSVPQNVENEYRIQLRIGSFTLTALIDTGMTSPDCLIGLGLDYDNFSAIVPNLDFLSRIEVEDVGDAGPRFARAGLATVSIDGLDNSDVETYVAEVGDNLLGVCYFHALQGYELVWDLSAGSMTIRQVRT